MGEIVSFFASSIGGSLLGAVGAAISRWQEGKQKLKEMDIELRKLDLMQKHEADMIGLQHTARVTELEAEQESTVIRGEYEGLKASLEADQASYSVGSESKLLEYVDVLRGAMRPVLTGFLVTYMMAVLFIIMFKYEPTITSEQAYLMMTRIIECLLVGANVALAWWFGARTHLTKSGG